MKKRKKESLTFLQKRCRGRFVVEMAYMIPVIFLAFTAVVYGAFYFHDKNILMGAAYETAVAASNGKDGAYREESDALEYFQERIQGKLIFFGESDCEISISEEEVVVSARAKKGVMALSVQEKAAVTEPENWIRDIRRARALAEDLKEKGSIYENSVSTGD